MSNHLITAAYKADLRTPMRKAVMVLLADKASDDGAGIWASKQTMADELCCSKQAVITTIRAFIDEGLLTEEGQRKSPTGYTVCYAINVAALRALKLVKCHAESDGKGSTSLTGQPALPVNEDYGRGQPGLPKPPLNPIPPSLPNGRETPAAVFDDQEQGDALPAGVELPPPAVKLRPHMLPDGWQPPAVAELGDVSRRLVEQWPSGAYEAVAEQFRMHWAAATGRTAKKSNWSAAWAKWLITEHDRIMRAAKAGTSFAAAAPPKPSAAPQDHQPVAAKAGEDDRSAIVHNLLERDLGPRTYAKWIKAAAITFDDAGAVVTFGSEFQRSYAETNLGARIAIALARSATAGEPAGLRFTVETPHSRERIDHHG